MSHEQPVRVWIACRQAAPWPDMFVDYAAMLTPAKAVGDADVVVADQASLDAAGLAPELLSAQRPTGLVGLGSIAAADVSLPPNASPREVALSCQLLGEVVRLRRQLARAELQHGQAIEEARTDALTGLPNRRAWDEQLVALSQPDGPPVHVCVAVVDLDHFKQTNDHYGHGTGDSVLRAVAHAMRARLRQQDLVARLGGDEFGILSLRLEEPEAGVVFERMRERVAIAGVPGNLPACTASIGYCVSDQLSGAPSAQICEAADRAMNQAKTAGRNRVVAFRR